ncbi:MAG: hypothetical protein S4CHLAM7_00470 [Chlamydiae bacterium]|nr:hypothetical protein [Chlamydiota bacterium]
MSPQVLISFTTTPQRIQHITPMLESLKKQSYQGFKTILWLCHLYRRSSQKMTPEEIPTFMHNYNVDVRFCDDFGSNTKLLPLLKSNVKDDAIIITADDDTCYPSNWVENLVQASLEDPNQAYGYRGKILNRRYFNLPFVKTAYLRDLSYSGSQTIMLKKTSDSKLVDILTGVWGICYRRSFFNESYFNLNLCPSAYHNDDLWVNGHLARNQVRRVCIGNEADFSDIPMEKFGVKRLWDNVNNGRGLNKRVLKFFKYDFKDPRANAQSV